MDEIDLAGLASLIADPARARMLRALMGGTALTATELAIEAGVAPSTASSHLAKLTAGEILAIEKQGRHRYFRLFDAEVASMLEELTEVAARRGPSRRIGPADPALRAARVCYDHLAGELGVQVFDSLAAQRLLRKKGGALELTPAGRRWCAEIGVDLESLARQRRPLARPCLDWSVRRHHLAGSLGAALLTRCIELGWLRRARDSRVLDFSAAGERAFRERFGLTAM
jgi:DNA-binding transcriptional ArsR family regulator